MRFQPELSTYSHFPQRKKKEKKERNDYYYSFNLLNPEGTIHLLLKGDILTSYEQESNAMRPVLCFMRGTFRRMEQTFADGV
jgi:hypothetical protein